MSVRFQYGNVLSISNVQLICHQVNCLTVKAHGLSAQIARSFPWADVYRTRTPINGRNLATLTTRGVPGKVRLFTKTDHPVIACMQAQWDYGRCDGFRNRNIQPYFDTKENRERWFKQCLEELGSLPYQTIAFPFKIWMRTCRGKLESIFTNDKGIC